MFVRSRKRRVADLLCLLYYWHHGGIRPHWWHSPYTRRKAR